MFSLGSRGNGLFPNANHHRPAIVLRPRKRFWTPLDFLAEIGNLIFNILSQLGRNLFLLDYARLAGEGSRHQRVPRWCNDHD